MSTAIINSIRHSFGIETAESDFMRLLAGEINYLIVHDFNKLVSVLYRADVSEKKLNAVLDENKGKDAGHLIAKLFIERQQEKFRSRNEFGPEQNPEDDEEERW